MTKQRFRLDLPPDDEEWDDDEDDLDDGECPEPAVEGPHYAPVFTGLIREDGSPIIRHPIVIRMGFHPEDRRYHAPTLSEEQMHKGDGTVFGWVYD